MLNTLNIHLKYTNCNGLLANAKDNVKRESDFSYFHCGPFAPAVGHSGTPPGEH